MNWLRGLFLGDSLTHGSRDPHGLSWPFYLAHLAAGDGYYIFPELCATPGWRSSELLRAVMQVDSFPDVKEAFLLIGTNDAKDPTPADVYIANVSLIVARMATMGIRTYVLTIPLPSGFGAPGYTAGVVRIVRKYNERLRASFPLLVECELGIETVDGVHFSEGGAREVARRVWHTILETRRFGY